jgi:DNA polymerase II large subunit
VIEARVGERACPDCGEHTYELQCDCGAHTEPYYECRECGTVCEPDESGRVVCDRCDREVESPREFTIDLNETLATALDDIGEREGAFEMLKGVKGLSSADKTPEPLGKGVLRAKHGVSAFKDGTVRYDMTDLPVTAVRPAELDVTADHFRQLGYETDVDGEPLRHDDQLVELKVQDIVLSDGAAQHMMRTADFVDDLLEGFYDLEPFYEVNERDDLVGELVFGMAPHTSAAVVGRTSVLPRGETAELFPPRHEALVRRRDGGGPPRPDRDVRRTLSRRGKRRDGRLRNGRLGTRRHGRVGAVGDCRRRGGPPSGGGGKQTPRTRPHGRGAGRWRPDAHRDAGPLGARHPRQ